MRPLLSPFPTLLSLEKEIYLTLWVSFVLRGDPINETITEMGLPRSPAQALALYSLCSPFFHVASPSRNLGLNSDREKIFLELCFLSVLQALMNGLFIYLFIYLPQSVFYHSAQPGLQARTSNKSLRLIFIHLFLHSFSKYLLHTCQASSRFRGYRWKQHGQKVLSSQSLHWGWGRHNCICFGMSNRNLGLDKSPIILAAPSPHSSFTLSYVSKWNCH